MISSISRRVIDLHLRTRASLNEVSWSSILALYGFLGALVLLATFFFSFIVPQTPGRLERASYALVTQLPFWDWFTSLPAPIPDNSQTVAAWLLFVIIVAFAAYGAALFVSTQRGGSGRVLLVVAGMGLFFAFANVWALPNVNTDIYNYIMRGRVAAVYGENPYGVAVDEFPDDPIYPYASHRFTEGPGGKLPTWMALNIMLAKIAGDNPIANLFTYRLTLFLLNVLCLGLVIQIVQALDARRVLTGVVLYSWNPIIILFAQSKTDTLMALFVLLAAWVAVTRGRSLLAFTLLVLSVFIKLTTAPLVVIYMLRSLVLRQWRELVGATLIASILFALVGLLFYFSAPNGQMLLNYLGLVDRAGPAESSLLRTVVLGGFILLTAAIGLFQDGSERRLLAGWAITTLLFSVFLTNFTFSWYFIVAIALVAVLADRHLGILLLAISFSSFLFNAWDSTFTSAFPPPDFLDVPRSVLYVVIAAVIALLLTGSFYLRRFQLKRAR